MREWLARYPDRLALALICFALTTQTIRILPIQVEGGDIAYKIRATHEFVASGFSSLDLRYPGAALDSYYQFFPAITPFIQDVRATHMYVFPFQYTILVAPFYALGGPSGFYVLTLICSLCLTVLCWLQGHRLGLPRLWIAFYTVATICCIGLLPYVFNGNEHILTATLTFLGMVLAHGSPRFSKVRFLVSGCVIGLGTFFRPETALFGFLIAIAILFFRREPIRLRLMHTVAFSFGFVLFFALWILSNWIVTDHLLGLQATQIQTGDSAGLAPRISALANLWRRSAGGGLLFDSPVFFLALLIVAYWRNASDTLRQFAFVSISFCILLPLLIRIEPGQQYGDRYLLSAYPLLATTILLICYETRNRMRHALLVAVVLASAYTLWNSLSNVRDNAKFRKHMTAVNADVQRAVQDSQVVILRNLTFNIFYLNERDLTRTYFWAESDEHFGRLLPILRAHNIKEITIIHSRIRGTTKGLDGQIYHLPDTMIPDFAKAVPLTSDRGNSLLEIRKYRL